MKKLILTLVVLLATSFAFTQNVPPAIFYSDLTSGPITGGQNNAGAFVTIHGKGFGASQGSSSVTIGGGAAASYQSWSNTLVTFQLGSAAKTGNIVVNVGGVTSNSVPFTVRSGNIYFVSTTGSDTNAGSYTAPWLTLVHAVSSMPASSITYVENGYAQNSVESNGSALVLAQGGTASAPNAIVGYPNSSATIGTTGITTGITISASNWVLSNLIFRGAQTAVSIANITGIRLAGNDVSCPDATASGACILAGNGGSSFAFLGNSIHNNGAATSANQASYEAMYLVNTNGVQIGWNLITNTLGCNAIGVHSTSAPLYSYLVHDNYIYETPCEAIALGTVNPALGAVSVYNNIIQSSGTGPAPAGTSQGYGYAAIVIGGGQSTPAQVFNNTIYDAGAFGGESAGAIRALGAVNLTNNIFYLLSGEQYVSLDSTLSWVTGTNNLFYGAGSPLGVFSNSVAGNPNFASLTANNFHLAAGSPAIDSGANVTLATDYDGVPRPQGPAYDIGAYEFPEAQAGTAQTPALAITTASLPAGTVGAAYSTTFTAINGTAPYTWTDPSCSGSCNTGMSFSAAGVLSGTPVNAGTSTFTFMVTDSVGHTATQQLPITIATAAATAAVSFSPTSLTFASQTVATTSAAQTITLKNTGAGALSISGIAASGNFAQTNTCGSSLAASASCAILVSFTPTAAGTLTGSITFTDNAAASPQAVSLSGTAVAALAITSTSLPAGVVGTAYSATLAATGGVAPYTWTDTPCNGSCNSGMAFTSAGVLSGTPVNAGTSTFTFTVTDSVGHTASTQLSITITAATTLAITTTSLPAGTVGTAYSTTFTAVNGTAPYTWTDPSCSGSCNTGMSFSAAGVLSGTPVNAGISTFTFTVTDSAGHTASTQLPITITAAATPAVNLSSTSLSFGSQSVGTISAAQTITLKNTGAGALSISGIAASGNFAQTNTCGSSLAASASCAILVSFTPTAAGTLTGSITFTDNAAASPQAVSLSGTAVAAAAAGSTPPSVMLSWNAASGTVAGYEVYRSTQSGTGYTLLTSSPVTSLSYTDTTVSAGQTYYYVLTSVISSGVQSAYSGQVTAAVPAS